MNDFVKLFVKGVLEGSPLRNDSFEELLLEAVDEGLSSLGDSAKQVIYFYLEKTFKINRRDIPYKIEEFADAIEKFFGPGAKPLEILAMRHLHKKIGRKIEYNQELGDLIFIEYVAAARRTFLKRKKQESTPALRGRAIPKKQEKIKSCRKSPRLKY